MAASHIVIEGGTIIGNRPIARPLSDSRIGSSLQERDPGGRPWTRHYGDLGIGVLENRHTVLRRRDNAVVLAGVTDLSASHASQPAHAFGVALAGARSGARVVLLDHQPNDAAKAAAKGALPCSRPAMRRAG